GGHAAPVCGRDLAPGPSPIRRLNRVEYDNTVRDLLGDDSHPSSAFPPEEEALGFDNQATTLGVTELLAEKYQEAAEALAAGAAPPGTLPRDAAAVRRGGGVM